jgi:hypothetical protein
MLKNVAQLIALKNAQLHFYAPYHVIMIQAAIDVKSAPHANHTASRIS